MWRSTRASPWVLVGLLVAPACGGGSPMSPTTPSGSGQIKKCETPTNGAMTADLDGTPWMPVSTGATWYGVDGGIRLDASDCTHALLISVDRFKGPGTYDIAGGEVFVDLRCDGNPCGVWKAGNGPAEPSGVIEGTFTFTLVSLADSGATGTRVITNGRFGSRFSGL